MEGRAWPQGKSLLPEDVGKTEINQASEPNTPRGEGELANS